MNKGQIDLMNFFLFLLCFLFYQVASADDFSKKMAQINEMECKEMNVNVSSTAAFSEQLNQALKQDDCETISKMVYYPLQVNFSSKKFTLIKTPKKLCQNYSQIFTRKLKKEVIIAKPEDLFCKFYEDKFTYTNGLLWLDGNKIKVINRE